MTTSELLEGAGVRTVLIIDDGYDAIPTPSDLAGSDDAWANFFDDLGDDVRHVVAAFPAYSDLTADELKASSEFVGAIWGLRGTIREETWIGLFEVYEATIRADRQYLSQLEEQLRALGLNVETSGRERAEATQDLFFIDLFLGAAQEKSDIDRSIAMLKRLTQARYDAPPLVVLMSRSEVIADHSSSFRDDAKLLGAMFRVAKKTDLLDGGYLERTVARLATHAADARKVATFLRELDKGFDEAKAKFLKVARRLDLSDYAQINDLLLDREGQPLGSYVLDLFDRVLQFEVESSRNTIDAAEALSHIDPQLYPSPHIGGSPDLQDLVNKTIWQSPERLRVTTTVADIPVGFGDLLVRKSFLAGARTKRDLEVLVVMTPACDLVRMPAEQQSVMLLPGTLEDLTPKSWTYKEAPVRTPIVIMPSGDRYWIRWSLKALRSVDVTSSPELVDETAGAYSVVCRFREHQAIELQQKLLADMGRVGLPAKSPATFPVEISILVLHSGGAYVALDVPSISQGGVCYVGQNLEGKVSTRLILTEQVVDEVLLSIGRMVPEQIHPRARPALETLHGQNSLAGDLQKGLLLPEKEGYVEFLVEVNEGGTVRKRRVGHFARNPPAGSTHQLDFLEIIVRDIG